MHKVFVAYHHKNDQWYKNELIEWAERNEVFIDGSVGLGDIPEEWDDQKVREYIRDEYLRDTTVTIVLVGTETRFRKHVDWEIFSSMHDGKLNKKSGLVIVMLPSTGCSHVYAAHTGEKADVFTTVPSNGWGPVNSREQCNNDYPYIPDRITDQILSPDAKVSIINWDDFYPYYPQKLETLIDNAYNDRASCKYDMTRPMRERNHNI